MSRQSTFSKLTMAATVLFVASITGFAQDESAKSQTETTGVEVVAINKTPKSIELFSTKSSAPRTASTKKETGFSAAKFMEAARASVNDTVLNVSTPASIESRSMKAEDFDQPAKSSSIVFVPSRGQKYPYQQ